MLGLKPKPNTKDEDNVIVANKSIRRSIARTADIERANAREDFTGARSNTTDDASTELRKRLERIKRRAKG